MSLRIKLEAALNTWRLRWRYRRLEKLTLRPKLKQRRLPFVQ